MMDFTRRGLFRTLVGAGVVLFALFVLWQFLTGVTSVILLILLGVLFAVIISAPVEALHRRKIPRPVSSPLVVIAFFAILLLLGYLFLPQLAQQLKQLIYQLPQAVSSLQNRIQQLLSSFGLNLFGGGGGFSLRSFFQQFSGVLLGLFQHVIFLVGGVVGAVFLAIYLAASPQPVANWVIRLFPPDHRDRMREVLAKSRSNLLDWLKGQVVSMTIIGVLSGVALWLIGIPGAVLLGIFAGLMEFIPIVGPWLAGVPPALLGLLGNPIHAVYVVVAYLLIQQIESNIVTPLVMGEVAEVHPAVVISFITLMGAIFGLLGALLAVPIAIVANVLVHELWFRRLERENGNGKETTP